MEYTKLTTRPIRFLALTGHTIEEFDALFPYFEDAHERYLSRYHVNGKPRTGPRRFTLYSNSPLPGIRERLIFILLYLKTNPIQEVHAEMFDMEQKQCNEFIHCFKKILDMALAEMDVMPAETQAGLEEKLEKLPVEDRVLLHDGTEREVPRPVDEEKQKDNYSGKKKGTRSRTQ
jgi:hypothetical protein